MKTKIILAIAFSLLLWKGAEAQFTAGVKGGFNVARLSGFEGNSRLSGHLGLFLHHRFNSRWSLQPEILYSGEGQKYFDGGIERTIALGYIDIPVMAQYYLGRQLYLEFGPQLGFLVSAIDKGTGPDNYNTKSDFENTQVALDLGIGVQATNKIGFYGRYNIGLTDVTLDDIIDHSLVGQIGMTIRLQ